MCFSAFIQAWLIIITLLCPIIFATYTVEASANTLEATVSDSIENIVSLSYYEKKGEYNVGHAVTLYNADTDNTYYIVPVFCNQECVGMIELDSVGNVTLNHSPIIYTELLKLDDSSYLLYSSGGMIYAELSGKIIELYDSGLNIPSNPQFLSLSFTDKLALAEESLETASAVLDISSVIRNVDITDISDSQISTYSSVPTIESNKCSITNFVKQNGYDICWAACVATIANYKKGYSLTAEDVSLDMNHDYLSAFYDGATPAETISALSLYGLTYRSTSKISWSNVKTNINNNRPFILCMYGSTSDGDRIGHALTGYGYSCAYGDSDDSANQRYVQVWDPNGSKLSLPYYASSYSVSGYTMTWTYTLID